MKINKSKLTVIVSTVLVLEDTVWELTISPIIGLPSVGDMPGLPSLANCGGGGGGVGDGPLRSELGW